MHEANIFVLIGIFLVFLAGGAVAGIIALASLARCRRGIDDVERRNKALERRIARLESLRIERPGAVLDQVDLEGIEEAAIAAEREAREFVDRVRPERPPSGPPTAVASGAPPGGVGAEAILKKRVPPGPPPSDTGQPWWEGLEETIGKRWMTWGGALALFISAGFFLKYAFENQWLGPTGRVVLGIVCGMAMLVAGDQCVRREMRALGQGLMGGALAVLYVSLFAAFSLYDVIPQIPTFGAMVIVTAAGMALAVLHNAVPLGFLAVLGGLLTPLMVSTGQDARDSLFAYLTILNLGVLGVALFKRWRALDVLVLVGTWLLFAGWFSSFYRASALVPAVLWVTVFFVTFLVIPFLYQLRTGTASSIESFLMALANAVVTFAFFYRMLRVDYPHVLGFIALAMAACYILLAAVLRRQIPDDARTLFGFVGLSVILLTLAVPLHLRLHGITLAWAVEGPVLLYLGYVFTYRPVRIAGFLVLVLAAARLFYAHWPFHTALFVLFFNRQFASAMFVPLCVAVYAAIHHVHRKDATEVDLWLMLAAGLFAGGLAMVIASGELSWWFRYKAADFVVNWRYFSFSATAALWGAGAAGFLGAALAARSKATFFVGLAVIAVAVFFSLASYSVSRHQNYLLFLNVRFAAGLLVTLTIFGFLLVSRGWGELFSGEDTYLSKGILAAAGLFPLALLSVEAYSYCLDTIASRRKARWTAQMALSVVWGVYAVGILAIGFWRRVREVRIAALCLLAVVAAKVLLIDMAQVQQIFRIVSFVVVGLMMIFASYLYHRLELRLGEMSGKRS